MTTFKAMSGAELSAKMNGKRDFVPADTLARDMQIKGVTVVEAKEEYGAFVKLDKGVLRKAIVANTELDLAKDMFTLASLEHFAKQLKSGSVTLQLFHDSKIPVGRWVDGEVKVSPSGGFELEAVMWIQEGFVVPDQPVTVIDAVDGGTLKHVSVGFTGMKYAYIEKEEGQGYWEINPNPSHPKGGALIEISLVNYPAQIGTEVKEITHMPERAKAIKPMKQVIHIGGQKHMLEAAEKDGLIEVKGLEELIDAHTKAVDENSALKAKIATLEANNEATRSKLVIDVANYSKDTANPILVEDAQKMTTTDLIVKAVELMTSTVKAVETETAPKTYNYE